MIRYKIAMIWSRVCFAWKVLRGARLLRFTILTDQERGGLFRNETRIGELESISFEMCSGLYSLTISAANYAGGVDIYTGTIKMQESPWDPGTVDPQW